MLEALPDNQDEPRLGSQRAGDVRERGGRIGEEHRPEAADRHVEAGGAEAMQLRVTQLVADVVQSVGGRQLTGALEHALGHVDADHAARRRGARRLACRQPATAADVEDLVAATDPVRATKVLMVSAQLGVVEVQAARRGHRRDAMDPGGTPAPGSQRSAATPSRSAHAFTTTPLRLPLARYANPSSL